MVDISAFLEDSRLLRTVRSSNVFRPKNLLLFFGLIAYTCIIFSISNYRCLEGSPVKYVSDGVIHGFLNELDVGCNGYSMDQRINEQKRILQSIRSELIGSSEKLKDINAVMDELNKQIPEKQLELSSIGDEIDSAGRALIELRDKRNVRVFLPHTPLYPNSSALWDLDKVGRPPSAGFEDIIDFSRCSISSWLPIYLEKSDNSAVAESFYKEIHNIGTFVPTIDMACLIFSIVNGSIHTKTYKNHVVLNVGAPISPQANQVLLQSTKTKRYVDEQIHLNIPEYDVSEWKDMSSVLPYMRKFLFTILVNDESQFDLKILNEDLLQLQNSAAQNLETLNIIRCKLRSSKGLCKNPKDREDFFKSSMFCVILRSDSFQLHFWESLKAGCIPVVLAYDQQLPFENLIDWRLASYRIAAARLPEVHFILRAIEMTDVLEMRRMGRFFFENYLANTKVVTSTILSSFAIRLGVPLKEQKRYEAAPLFNGSFVAPILIPVNVPMTEEYLGPLEAPVESPSYLHNFTHTNLYAHKAWNQYGNIAASPEFLLQAVEPPTETEFYSDSNIGFRSIEPGSGAEFSRALGGNTPREQFTIVLLTYNRDSVLMSSIEKLHGLPYLHKVIVIWNNIGREPIGAWPRLHVPVEFIRMDKNSLNNRFIPWDRIQTEAVLSLDDDIDLEHAEIHIAFRVWRENRDRLVGFPARFHAKFGDEMFYNSNHTCQFSIILTGAAFIHKSYLHDYTTRMPEVIRQHVDTVQNCEDIAMNFWIAHITRRPPIKTTSRWTLRCPNCAETLSQDKSHFQERHECIRLFTKVYGYNPLKFTQFRADSVLFKTRLPADKQKCFRYV